MRLIDADVVTNELLSRTYYGNGEYYAGLESERDSIVDMLREALTVDNRVFCQSCAHYNPGNGALVSGGSCGDGGIMGRVYPRDYCSRGELKEI